MYASLRLTLVTLLLFISIGCIASNEETTVTIRETEKVSNKSGNIFQLRRLNVQCHDNEVLSYWHLISHAGKIHIKYYCIQGLSVIITNEIRYTPWNKTNKDQKRSVNYLDRHRVLCNEDEAIGSFQMEKSGKKIRFRYRCNKIKAGTPKTKTTKWEKAGLGEVQNLDVQTIAGDDYKQNSEVLRGWIMRTKYVNRWCNIMCDATQYIRFETIYSKLVKPEPTVEEDLDIDF